MNRLLLLIKLLKIIFKKAVSTEHILSNEFTVSTTEHKDTQVKQVLQAYFKQESWTKGCIFH